jgi:hypothetical protein
MDNKIKILGELLGLFLGIALIIICVVGLGLVCLTLVSWIPAI